MAALKVLKVKGLKVELWATSFRVGGMSKCFHLGEHAGEAEVIQMVNAIYDKVYRDAIKAAHLKVAQEAYKQTLKLLEG